MSTIIERRAWYDGSTPAIVIDQMSVTDPSVIAESHRWSQGLRGPVVSEAEMAGADLEAFVTQSIAVGAHAISSAGGVQDTFNLEGLIRDVGMRTDETTAKAAIATADIVAQAAATFEKASGDARKAIIDAGIAARQSFSENVDQARKLLTTDIDRLLGGQHPELLTRISPMLDAFSRDLNDRAAKQTAELITNAARQFDPADPTSPMAKHNQELKSQQDLLAATLQQNHQALTAKVEELATAVKAANAAKVAANLTVQMTTLKGDTYAQNVHRVMREIAVGLGDEYVDTGAQPGAIPHCKKGDALLTINGGAARVVLEMTDSSVPRKWSDYLDTAERNRMAVASIGLVPTPELNDGHGIRCLGQRRVVMAFDPQTDDPELLRTVIQVLRLGALSAGSRQDVAEIETAQEKIEQAMALLTKIDSIKHIAGLIKGHAAKIDLESESFKAAVERLLSQAQTALAGATEDNTGHLAA